MSAVLVTGGTGDLGDTLGDRLVNAGHAVRIMSRRHGPASGGLVPDWAQASLETGDGIDCVAHCASSPFRKTKEIDVEGTRRLLDACKAVGRSISGPIGRHSNALGLARMPDYSDQGHATLRPAGSRAILTPESRRLIASSVDDTRNYR